MIEFEDWLIDILTPISTVERDSRIPTALVADLPVDNEMGYMTVAQFLQANILVDSGGVITGDLSIEDAIIWIAGAMAKKLQVPRVVTGSADFVIGDTDNIVVADNAADAILTIQSETAFGIGTRIDVISVGAGAVEIQVEAPLTLEYSPTFEPILAEQFAAVTLTLRQANTWHMAGYLLIAE